MFNAFSILLALSFSFNLSASTDVPVYSSKDRIETLAANANEFFFLTMNTLVSVDRLSQKQQIVQGAVANVSVSPDNKYLAIFGSNKYENQILNTQSKEVSSLSGISGEVEFPAYFVEDASDMKIVMFEHGWEPNYPLGLYDLKGSPLANTYAPHDVQIISRGYFVEKFGGYLSSFKQRWLGPIGAHFEYSKDWVVGLSRSTLSFADLRGADPVFHSFPMSIRIDDGPFSDDHYIIGNISQKFNSVIVSTETPERHNELHLIDLAGNQKSTLDIGTPLYSPVGDFAQVGPKKIAYLDIGKLITIDFNGSVPLKEEFALGEQGEEISQSDLLMTSDSTLAISMRVRQPNRDTLETILIYDLNTKQKKRSASLPNIQLEFVSFDLPSGPVALYKTENNSLTCDHFGGSPIKKVIGGGIRDVKKIDSNIFVSSDASDGSGQKNIYATTLQELCQ